MLTEVDEAAALWGATVTRPLKLRENEVHAISLGGQPAALRLHRLGYQTKEAIQSELWWCRALAERGLPVACAIQSSSGDLLETLSSGRFASVVSWVDGQPLGEAGVRLTGSAGEKEARHRALGALVARVHQATDQLTLPDWFARPSWDRDGLTGEAPFWGRFWEHPLLSPDQRDILMKGRKFLRERLATTQSPTGLIHADVLRENIFVNNGSLSLIDFDDSGFGFRWYDLGTVLSQDLYEPDYEMLRAALLDGYASVLAVDRAEVDTFTMARTLASVGWAAPRVPLDHPVHSTHIARAVMMTERTLARYGIY